MQIHKKSPNPRENRKVGNRGTLKINLGCCVVTKGIDKSYWRHFRTHRSAAFLTSLWVQKMAAAGKGALKCLQVCGYCCQFGATVLEWCKATWNAITKVCTCGQGWKGLVTNTLTLCGSEEDPDYKDFGLPVIIDRRFTDFPAVFLFLGTLIGMFVVLNRALAYGKPEVYSRGYDRWGNVCGVTNDAITGVTTSGLDMTAQTRVLIVDFITRPAEITPEGTSFANITQLCVTHCPAVANPFTCTEYLKDAASAYPDPIRRNLCSSSSSQQDFEFVIQNSRCIPSAVTQGWSIQKQNLVLNLYGQNWLHNFISDCWQCAAELTWIALIALGFTLLFVVVTYGAASALCWYSFATFIVAGASATGYMWYLWTLIYAADPGITYRTHFNGRTFQNNVLRAALRLFPYGRNTGGTVPQQGYSIVFRDAAIYSTVAVVVFSIVILMVGKRNMETSAVLFTQAADGLASIRWMYLLPLLSVCSITIATSVWLHTVKYVTAVFLAEPEVATSPSGEKSVSYTPDTTYTNAVLAFEFFALFWMLSFIMACQYLTICLAIGTWYFSIDKENMYRPMRVASSRLIRRHLGSVALGSILVGLFGYFRAPLRYVQLLGLELLGHTQGLREGGTRVTWYRGPVGRLLGPGNFKVSILIFSVIKPKITSVSQLPV